MRKTILRTMLAFVIGHLVLGVGLLVIAATHGINDQDASFSLALAFHGLNLPTIWLLRPETGTGPGPAIALVMAAGVVQWACIGLVIGLVVHAIERLFRLLTGRAGKTA